MPTTCTSKIINTYKNCDCIEFGFMPTLETLNCYANCIHVISKEKSGHQLAYEMRIYLGNYHTENEIKYRQY